MSGAEHSSAGGRTPAPGVRLGNRYQLLERIGGGGMGEVWRATDQVLGRPVAVKLMRPELVAEPGFADRFLAEARTMATIRHHGVVAIHDFHGDTANAFLVMEYVAGEALSELLHRTGRLDPPRAMRLLAQAAEALQAAHAKGVVHRDIKPGNLLVGTDDTLVLTDFGIARSAAATQLTVTGAVLGTPAYLAPEQVLGKPATARSDLYALGVVAYECLMGHRPFDGDNPFEVAMKRLQEAPPTMAHVAPPAVLAVVERALAAEPEQRWRSAAELAEAARRAISPGFSPGRAALPPPPRPLPATRPAAVATAAPPPYSTAGPPPQYSAAASVRPAPPPQPAPMPHRPPPSHSPPPFPAPAAGRPPPRPPRPIPVIIASLLLVAAAAGLLTYSLATLAVIEEGVEAGRQLLGPDFEQWRDGVTLMVLLGTVAVALLGLLYLLLAIQITRGKRGARDLAVTLGIPFLCCCIPCWWVVDTDGWAEQPDAAVFVAELTLALPTWYEPLAGLAVLTTLATMLVAVVLLMLPPTNRWLRPPPPVHAPYHPYGYPPR